MGWIVTAFIDIAFDDGWRHPAVGKDEFDPALFGLLFGVACGSSRFAVAFVVIVADVSPPLFFDERHGCRKGLKATVEVSHY